jgi:fumarate reductase subunit C
MSRKPYVRAVSKTGWFLKHPRYLRYMSREVTCIPIGAFALLLVCVVDRLAKGPEAFAAFMAALKGPWSFLGMAVILAFSVYNATNWFNVTPKAMPVQTGEEFLDGKYIVGAHYAVWAIATLVVLFFAGVL